MRALHNILGGVVDPVSVGSRILGLSEFKLGLVKYEDCFLFMGQAWQHLQLYIHFESNLFMASFVIELQCLVFPGSARNRSSNWFSVILEQNAAYLILRGLKTLDLRVKQQNNTATLLASKLEAHPKVCNVYYFHDL